MCATSVQLAMHGTPMQTHRLIGGYLLQQLKIAAAVYSLTEHIHTDTSAKTKLYYIHKFNN